MPVVIVVYNYVENNCYRVIVTGIEVQAHLVAYADIDKFLEDYPGATVSYV